MLEKQYTYGADSGENMIIHGDNLEALKSLLPRYERNGCTIKELRNDLCVTWPPKSSTLMNSARMFSLRESAIFPSVTVRT